MRYSIFLFIFTSCSLFSTSTKKDVEEVELYHVCKLACESKYSDTYGVQYRRVYDDVVYCRCMRQRGDMGMYIDLEETSVEPEVERFVHPLAWE
jgi:hypothetical protein